MAEERLGASFSIDVTNLKTGLAQANRAIRESESEFKAAAAGIDDWSKSEQGLQAKIKSLSDITAVQKEKVNALKNEYQRLIDNGLDPASKEAVEFRTKINNEEAALKKNEAELQKQKDALNDLEEGTEEAGKGFEKFGNIAKGAAKVAAAAIAAAAAAVGALVKQSLDSYAEYEQLVGGVDTLFGKSSDKVQQYAANAYKTAGMTANEYMETVTGMSASLIQSLGGDTEKAAEKANMAITDMSDNANKMGSDIESLQNAYGGFAKGNFTMLDNLKLGYGGTQEEMKRLLKDAEKISGVKYDVSSYGDIVDAIHVVQTEMQITGTTAKEASTTIQGSVASMKGAWSNLVTGLADENADIDGLIKNLIDSVTTVIGNILPRIKIILSGILTMVSQLLPQIPPLIQQILPDLISGVMDVIKSITEVLPQLLTEITNFLPQLVGEIIEMLPAIVRAVLDIVTNIITALGEALPEILVQVTRVIMWIIGDLIGAIPDLLEAAITFFTAIVEAVPEIIDSLLANIEDLISTLIYSLLNALPDLLKAAIELLNAIIQAIPVIIDLLIQYLPWIIDTLIKGLVDALPQLLNAAITLLMAIVKAIPTIAGQLAKALPMIISTITSTLIQNLPLILKAAIQLFMALVKAIPSIISELKKTMPSIIKGMVQGIKDGIPDILKAGEDLIKGLWNGIKNMKDWVIEKVKGLGGDILGGLKNFFGIHSPSKLIEDEIGVNIGAAVGTGTLKSVKGVLKDVKNFGGTITKGFAENVTGKIQSLNENLANGLNYSNDVNLNGAQGKNVTVYQTNNYAQAHSRYELYKSKQQTAAAVRLALGE